MPGRNANVDPNTQGLTGCVLAGPPPQRGSAGAFWLPLLIIELVVLILHLNALHRPHLEGDEVVMTFLAERLRDHPSAYHVQGELSGAAAGRFMRDTTAENDPSIEPFDRASLIFNPTNPAGPNRKMYDPQVYDRPVFFHPPAYPYLLAAARAWFGAAGGILLSALAHLLAILFLALIGRSMLGDAVGLIAAALLAADPVSWICGQRLWIDGPLQAAVAGAALAAWWSAREGGAWRFALGGAVLGLAGLTKLTAGLLLPAIIILWMTGARRPARREGVAFLAAAAALVLPWLILSKILAGSFFSLQQPTPWMIERFTWVRIMVHRPAWYYIVGLVIVAPVCVYAIPAVIRNRRQPWLWFLAAWMLSVWGGLTLIGAAGVGFQLRYLTPGIPALCLLTAAGIYALPRPWRVLALVLAMYGLSCGIDTAGIPIAVDPIPRALARFLGEIFGWDLKRLLPGLW